MKSYVRIYSFISQLIRFRDVKLEKTYQLARFLVIKLPYEKETLPHEIKDNINMDSFRIEEIRNRSLIYENEHGELKPMSDGVSNKSEEDKEALSEILGYINEHYGADWTNADKVNMFKEDIIRRSKNDEDLIKALDSNINTKDNARLAFEEYFNKIASDMVDNNVDIYNKIYSDVKFGKYFKDFIFNGLFSSIQNKEQRDA